MPYDYASPLLGAPFFMFHFVGNIPSVMLASVMTSMMCSTCAQRWFRFNSYDDGPHSLEVLLSPSKVGEILILQLTAKRFCPENHSSHPAIFSLSTVVMLSREAQIPEVQLTSWCSRRTWGTQSPSA